MDRADSHLEIYNLNPDIQPFSLILQGQDQVLRALIFALFHLATQVFALIEPVGCIGSLLGGASLLARSGVYGGKTISVAGVGNDQSNTEEMKNA